MTTLGQLRRAIERLEQERGGQGTRSYNLGRIFLKPGAPLVDRSTGPLSLMQLLRGFKDDFCGSALAAAWTIHTSGTAAAIGLSTSAHGGDLVLRSGTDDNGYAYIDFNGNNCLCCGVGVTSLMIWKVKLNQAIASTHVEMGLIRTSTTPDEWVMVNYDTDDGDGHWYLETSTGGATTDTSSGEVPDTSDHWFKLTLSSDNVSLYIDDMLTPVATNRTNITAYNMEPKFLIQARAAASDKTMSLDFVAIIPDAGLAGVTGT